MGNILTASDGTTTHTYTYGNSDWKDLLTAFDGKAITYDAIGNPLSDGTWTYTWENGRQLATMSDGTKNLTFRYDAGGLRTQKTVDGVEHNYLYAGGKLLRETYGDKILDFIYDANGTPYALKYTAGTEAPETFLYYYITNLQGDVMQLVDASGNSVAAYEYDPYGKVISATGTMAEINPIRYRGYYYDAETQLYYLQSRYYNPEVGRFLNSDVFASTGQGIIGYNMFAYCNNNVTKLRDCNGEDPVLIAAVAGAVAGAAVGLFHYLSFSGAEATLGGALLSTTGGMLSGALGGAASILTGAAQITAVISSGLVAGLFADATGGDFLLSALMGCAGAYGGTLIDISMYHGMDLFFANLIASLGVGYPMEMISQSLYQDYDLYQKSQNSKSNKGVINKSIEAVTSTGVARPIMHNGIGQWRMMELL